MLPRTSTAAVTKTLEQEKKKDFDPAETEKILLTFLENHPNLKNEDDFKLLASDALKLDNLTRLIMLNMVVKIDPSKEILKKIRECIVINPLTAFFAEQTEAVLHSELLLKNHYSKLKTETQKIQFLYSFLEMEGSDYLAILRAQEVFPENSKQLFADLENKYKQIFMHHPNFVAVISGQHGVGGQNPNEAFNNFSHLTNQKKKLYLDWLNTLDNDSIQNELQKQTSPPEYIVDFITSNYDETLARVLEQILDFQAKALMKTSINPIGSAGSSNLFADDEFKNDFVLKRP